MSFKIIGKQIYKGFLVNWKLFVMLIFFCTSILAMIFGALSFAVQFKNEIYNPTIAPNAYSVGFLKNKFSYAHDPEADFRTNQEFEDYLLKELDLEIGNFHNYHFEYDDLVKIYQQDGYINFVDQTSFTENRVEAYNEAIVWSANFIGNVRSKIANLYLQERTNWTFNIRNNQGSVAKLPGDNFFVHFYSANLQPNNPGLINQHQMLNNESDFISGYISERQLNTTNQIGDLVTLNFDNQYKSKNLQMKIIGTFKDYATFANSDAEDICFLIDDKDYFNFVKNQNIGYAMIDYRNSSSFSYPLLGLTTYEQYSAKNFKKQFSAANQRINQLFFDHYQGNSLSNDLSSTIYEFIYQKTLMVLFIMLGIAFLLAILFYTVLYFLINQTIKTDLQLSFFLNNLGMSYREISWIQILRLTFPIFLSLILAFLASFGIKSLFWSAFSFYYNINLTTFYFNWINLLLFFTAIILIFGVLFFINWIINKKMNKNKNSLDRVTIVDRISAKTKSALKIKNHYIVISLSYGAKNVFQVFFISLITFIIFVIVAFSLNFTKNVHDISQIAAKHYAPIQSISSSKGLIVDEIENQHDFIYKNVEKENLIAIGENLDLKNDNLATIVKAIQPLFGNDVSPYYLARNFTKQINQDFSQQINQIEYDDLPAEIKTKITVENFAQLKLLINNCALLNSQLESNFGWNGGFNINFGQWNNSDLSETENTFFNFEGYIYDAISNQYISGIRQAFAIDSNNWFYQKNFDSLNNQNEAIILNKTPEQIESSELDQAIAAKHNGQVVLENIINAYFPMSYRDEKIIKLKISLSNKINTEVYLKNVGINKFDNWDSIFILNKKQLLNFIDLNLQDYQKKLGIKADFNSLANENLNKLDNGAYSTNSTPFFYRNLLLRSDGQGVQITNFLTALQSINIYGLNFDQIRKVINQKLSQFDQLITTIQVSLIILMVTISFILIFLVVKENESYFQNFKALGYKTWEITAFLLPWYLITTIISAIVAFLLIFFSNNFTNDILSQSLSMYLNYQVNFVVYLALIIIPIIFMFLISAIVYWFINKVEVTKIVS